MKILICGLPGTGKSTLAKALAIKYNAIHINADEIRELFKDKDFSLNGRMRQASRMRALSAICERYTGITVIADFVAPTPEFRAQFDPNFTVWMDRPSTKSGLYKDTELIWQAPHSSKCIRVGPGLTVDEEVFIVSSCLD